MATTTKESVLSNALPQNGVPVQDGPPPAQSGGAQTSPRTDAIGIEIPVVLYASRYSAAGRGLGKTPPPVREETRTVIVFAQGAVVRLTAKVEVGEMVVLTNQQTGADVLCRVGAVKAQAGIQNYVDLEFTQRAAGFWDAGSAADSSVRSAPSAPEPAARTVETPAMIPTPRQRPVSSSSATSEIASSIAAAPPAPVVATTPTSSFTLESPQASPVRAVHTNVPTVPNVISGASAGLRVPKSAAPSMLMGDRLESGRQSQPSSKKGLWVGIAAVFVAGIAAGGLLLNHRGQSAAPETAAAVAAPSAPVQPAASTPSEEPQVPVAANPAPSPAAAAPAPVEAPTWLPETPRREKTPIQNVSQPVLPAQPAPRNAAIAVGKLATPIAKSPAVASSSEPPPVLPTQDSASAEGVLRNGELSGASHVEAPTAFVAAETSPAPPVQPAQPVRAAQPVAAGGRVEAPKLISSPNPVYPPMARSQSLEGVVALDALVDAAGNITEVKALSGPVLLRQAAIDALRKWKYQPGRVDGQPTAVHLTVNIRFALR